MPTYEYLCCDCGEKFEIFQKITDEPIKKCSKCGGKVKKLISLGGGVIYKGSGFYTTEYRSEEYKRKAKEETPVSSSTACNVCNNKTPSCPVSKQQ